MSETHAYMGMLAMSRTGQLNQGDVSGSQRNYAPNARPIVTINHCPLAKSSQSYANVVINFYK